MDILAGKAVVVALNAVKQKREVKDEGKLWSLLCCSASRASQHACSKHVQGLLGFANDLSDFYSFPLQHL